MDRIPSPPQRAVPVLKHPLRPDKLLKRCIVSPGRIRSVSIRTAAMAALPFLTWGGLSRIRIPVIGETVEYLPLRNFPAFCSQAETPCLPYAPVSQSGHAFPDCQGPCCSRYQRNGHRSIVPKAVLPNRTLASRFDHWIYRVRAACRL